MGYAIFFLLLAGGVEEHYARANRLFEQQKFAEANQALDEALAADPNHVASLTLKGKLAMAFERFEIARRAFERAAQVAPGNAQAQFLLGFFYYFENDFGKALAPLGRARQLNNHDPRPLLYEAMSQEGLARPDLAIPLYERTIELERSLGSPSAETHTAYGRLLYTLGRREDASKQFALVLEIDSQSRDGNYEMGRLHLDAGRWKEAARHGETALKAQSMGTTDRQIHFLLARAYGRLGNKEMAEAHRKKFEASPVTLRR
jgi:tetratricopeptide (TPR) repeat protein